MIPFLAKREDISTIHGVRIWKAPTGELIVVHIEAGSAFQSCGLRPGMQIRTVEGQRCKSVNQVFQVLNSAYETMFEETDDESFYDAEQTRTDSDGSTIGDSSIEI